MSNLYETLKALCEKKGIKGGRMCNDLGISKSLMTDLKTGRKKTVNAETAQKIAGYFGVSVGYLLGEENEKPVTEHDDELSAVKRKFIQKLKLMDDETILALTQIADQVLALREK